MVSHKLINNNTNSPEENAFFVLSVFCVVTDCSWQLRFDKKAKKLHQTYSFSN